MINLKGYYTNEPTLINERRVKGDDWYLVIAFHFNDTGYFKKSVKYFKTPSDIQFKKDDFIDNSTLNSYKVIGSKLSLKFREGERFECLTNYEIISDKLFKTEQGEEVKFVPW